MSNKKSPQEEVLPVDIHFSCKDMNAPTDKSCTAGNTERLVLLVLQILIHVAMVSEMSYSDMSETMSNSCCKFNKRTSLWMEVQAAWASGCKPPCEHACEPRAHDADCSAWGYFANGLTWWRRDKLAIKPSSPIWTACQYSLQVSLGSHMQTCQLTCRFKAMLGLSTRPGNLTKRVYSGIRVVHTSLRMKLSEWNYVHQSWWPQGGQFWLQAHPWCHPPQILLAWYGEGHLWICRNLQHVPKN